MNNVYNANMYLTPNDLNDIENKILDLNNLISEKIYNNEKTYLRNVNIGDDLSGKTVIFKFPRDLYLNILENELGVHTNIITTENGSIYCTNDSYNNNSGIVDLAKVILDNDGYTETFLYYYINDGTNIYNNPSVVYFKIKFMRDFGKVLSKDNYFSKYIFIYDNENIIPEYHKNIWNINEIPYVQDMNNIEYGISILGDYLGKPVGWINERNWDLAQNYLSDTSVTNIGVIPQGFSYIDINRWINNLNLIDSIDMDDITVWNTNKSQYYWNEGE